MKNKKIVIVFIIIVIIVAIITGIIKIMASYAFKGSLKQEIKIDDGDNKLINHLNKIENNEEKKEKVQWYLEANKITEQEAKEILEK